MIDFKNIIPTIRYIWATIVHKYFVFKAGAWTGASLWRLLVHDWTKFRFCEAPYYGRQFFGDGSDPIGFMQAWNHHSKSHDHHWEYWIPVTGHSRSGYPDLQPLPMSEAAIREMVADWMGAGRAYSGEWPESVESWVWWNANKDRIQLHPDTRILVNLVIRDALNNKKRSENDAVFVAGI